MSHIRLIGLLLFITAITLALAAAATRTTHVEVSSQWLLQFRSQPVRTGMESSTTIPPSGSTPMPYPDVQPYPSANRPELSEDRQVNDPPHDHNWDYAAHQMHADSTAIPIAWPLLATAAAGLLLWFVQPPGPLRPPPKKRSPHRRRRSRAR